MVGPGEFRLLAVGVVSEHTIHTSTSRGANGLIYPTHAALGVRKQSTEVDDGAWPTGRWSIDPTCTLKCLDQEYQSHPRKAPLMCNAEYTRTRRRQNSCLAFLNRKRR
jgi:hypothetical protein